MTRRLAIGMLLALVPFPVTVSADEIRPALLELTEREGGWVDVTWKVPMRGDRTLALAPILPELVARASSTVRVTARVLALERRRAVPAKVLVFSSRIVSLLSLVRIIHEPALGDAVRMSSFGSDVVQT